MTTGSPDRAATLSYVRQWRCPEGGFAPAAGLAADARCTLMSLIVLKAWGGGAGADELQSARRFILRCRQGSGFSPTPEAAANAFSTAIGLLAFAMTFENPAVDSGALERYPWPAIDLPAGSAREQCRQSNLWLSERARSFDEIRIATDILERVGERPLAWARWREVIAGQRSQGLPGGKAAANRSTALSVLPLLRMGERVPDRAAIAVQLREGQQPDGGYAVEDGAPSDLDTTYWSMRALSALGVGPKDPGALVGFLAGCRACDGGYALVAGGTPSTIGTGKAVKISGMIAASQELSNIAAPAAREAHL
jgi:hypothetical protein